VGGGVEEKQRKTTTTKVTKMMMSNTTLVFKMDISNIKLLNLLINRKVHISTHKHKQTYTHTQIQKAAILATSNNIRKLTKLYE